MLTYALVAFHYNTGCGWTAPSSMLTYLVQADDGAGQLRLDRTVFNANLADQMFRDRMELRLDRTVFNANLPTSTTTFSPRLRLDRTVFNANLSAHGSGQSPSLRLDRTVFNANLGRASSTMAGSVAVGPHRLQC